MKELKNKMIARIQLFWWVQVMRIKFWLLTRRVNTHVNKRQEATKKLNEDFNRNRLIWAYDGCLGKDGKGIRDLSGALLLLTRKL